jgi:4,5-DOPA dioxygenase extradiol
MTDRMPAIFFGHGSPMNALARNRYTEAWGAIGRAISRPKAILCISAHWYVAGTAVTANESPETIHDFGGFPAELFAMFYPAPGAPALARRVQDLLAPLPVKAATDWGFDHGTWSVLCHVFPGADIPVVQLSIDATKPARFHYEVGRQLGALREEGVLLAGSGNIVHNLRQYAWPSAATGAGEEAAPYDWAQRWDANVAELLQAGDHEALIDYRAQGRAAQLSIPTPEHYLPLLYIMGAARLGERVSFPVQGIDGGSISMRAVQFG